ncbi:MAG: Ig-like domain-containing protein [Verrucomicrobia bacterium]|nr:Ig-like domain-containing protein [Verrucomicrobiota bacterium]
MTRSVRPALIVQSPLDDQTLIEGTPLVIDGSAFGFSAALSSVRVYLNDRLLQTFNDTDFNLSLTDYEPGHHTIRVEARDARGLVTTIERDITVLFADGTLSPFVQYSFGDGLGGVTTNGQLQAGSVNFNPGNGQVWLSTPRLFLQAGETYVFQFDAHRVDNNNHTLFLALMDEPGWPTQPLALGTFNVNQAAWQTFQIPVTVDRNGAFHFTLYNDGQQNWNRIQIDNVRIVGAFNSAPTVAFTAPNPGTTTLAGSPLTLSVNASDPDGEVTRVEFWNGSILIGSITQPPYSLVWQSLPAGNLTVTAIAYDNDGGISDPAELVIHSLENRVSIATNLGVAGVTEVFYAAEYQSDGTLIVAGQLSPSFFTGLEPAFLGNAQAGDRGVIIRFSEDGRTPLSVTVVGTVVLDLALDAEDNIYAATGPGGVMKLNPQANSLIWHFTPEDIGASGKQAHRIDAAPGGMAAGLFATGSWGSQTLASGDVLIVHPNGQRHPQLMAGSGGTYTTDLAVDEVYQRVWIAGWKNFTTFEGSTNFPVDVPIFVARSLATETFGQMQIRGYDWESNDNNGRWLNRLDNNMADTRTQRIVLAPNGYVYVGLEYDGGNTPIRYSPYDLASPVQLVGGDSFHNNAFTSTVPKVAVIRLQRSNGEFLSGQYFVPRLNNGGDNTLRLTAGELRVDQAGRVHIAGSAASGSPFTFNPLPGLYTGGAVHWVMSPDLSTRELVTRWATDGTMRGVAISPSGRVAKVGNVTGGDLFRRRALLSEIQGPSDALLVVGDFASYYSFQPGNHPRLFFTANDIPELRYRSTQYPFNEMVDSLRDARNHNGDYLPFDPNHSYSRSMRAKINAFLYVLTGDEQYALAAREDVEWVIAGNGFAWADPSLMGLRSYWMATHVALAYDWCATSPHWDDAFLFQVSKSLLDIAKVIINNGGTEQNTSATSNWQGARGAAGGLALLATDSRFDSALLDAAYTRVRNYINQGIGTHPETRGWAPEGLGYTYYPFGLFVGPFSEAMARVDGRDLRQETAISEVYRAMLQAPTAAVNVYDYGGIKPDWANDNMHIRGEGVYGQAFFFVNPDLLPAARWIYDRLQGPLARDRARWDDTRGGTIWSFLHYPAHIAEQDPMEFYAWQRTKSDQHGIGITTFRNQYDGADDILAQFKARLFAVGGHDGPDGLGFRIIGNDTAWVVGGGRDEPGKRIGQATVYPVEPGSQLAGNTNLNTGTLVGTPLVRVDGGGHVIAQMAINNMNVSAHKRWFVTDFDQQATGAEAAFIVADTTSNGTWWQLPTSPFNTISSTGNTFTITAPNGATLQGTVLHPADATISHGSRSRGSGFAPLQGGSLADINTLNPEIATNNFVAVQGSGGQFLIAFTIQPAGDPHPPVTRTSGTVANASIQIGNRTYTLLADDVLYDGQTYQPAPALISFDVGQGSLINGNLNQSVAVGDSPVAPEIEPPAGQVFLGWDRRFDAITRDMVITAIYAPVETTPTAPSFLRGIANSGGTILLQWNDNSIGETGFTLEESVDGQNWTVAALLDPDSTSASLGHRLPQTLYSFRVRADGTEAPSAWSNTFTLSTPALNQPPVFTSTPPSSANEGQLFSYFVQSEDPEDDSLSLSLVEGPDWLQLYNTGGGGAILTGIPTAEQLQVAVTLSVSDGFNPPVLQSFELAINPAPEITLIWPKVIPAYLDADHWLHFEVETTDDSPVTVQWAVVQGPRGTQIEAESSATTAIYFERPGIYVVRLTATDAEGATSFIEADVLVERMPAFESAEVLEFSDTVSYVEANTNFRNANFSEQLIDVNGDGLAERRRFHAFSTQDSEGNWLQPLNPGASAATHGGRFFGGWIAERLNVGGSNTLNFSNPVGLTANNRISLRFTSAYEASMHAVLFWLREDFKNAGENDPVLLGQNSQLNITFGDFSDVGQLRWIVLANDTFYVSSTRIMNDTAGRTLNGLQIAQEMWAEYSPQAPIQLNFDQLNTPFNTPTSELGPIQGIGLLVDADGYTQRRFQLQVRRFALTAEIGESILPAPAIQLSSQMDPVAGESFALDALIDSALPSDQLLVEWSVIYGPGTVTFDDATADNTQVVMSQAGEYRLRLTVHDGQQSSSRDLILQIAPGSLSAAEQWRSQQFAHLSGGIQHPSADWLADPDGDGISNLMEYALGGNPWLANTAQLPNLSFAQLDGELYLQLEVSINPEASDIIYVVEVSGNLIDWHSTEGVDIETIEQSATHRVVQDRTPVTGNTPRFIRLRVDR